MRAGSASGVNLAQVYPYPERMESTRKSLYQRLAVEQAAGRPSEYETVTRVQRESIDDDPALLLSQQPVRDAYALETMTKMQIQESIDDDLTLRMLVAGGE